MMWGKLIGAVAGFALGRGLLGALVGLLIGHWVDQKIARGLARSGRKPSPGQRETGNTASSLHRQQVFTSAVVNLAAKLAKIDGQVTREEIDVFKAAFVIHPSQSAAIGAMYDLAKRDPSDYEHHARQLAEAFADMPQVLVEVLEALHRIALADGVLHPAEDEFLRRVAAIFGFIDRRFAQTTGDADPYAVLGVPRNASLTDIKAAWRKLTREHHPDTLMAKGMPKEYIDLATHKMAEINAAHDRILRERGEA